MVEASAHAAGPARDSAPADRQSRQAETGSAVAPGGTVSEPARGAAPEDRRATYWADVGNDPQAAQALLNRIIARLAALPGPGP